MIAVVERSGLDEAFHEGCVAAADLDGNLIARFGDIERPFYVRSAAKPFQAAVSVRNGADLPPEHLAVACASHVGTPIQVAIVRQILTDGGLSETDLRCPVDRPQTGSVDLLWASQGSVEERRIFHNCSGKHAAMLRACAAQGWPTETYLEPEHPLQERQLQFMAEIGLLVDDRVGVDGCGAPVYRITAHSLAYAFTHLNTEPLARVRSAMHRFPALVGGAGNADTDISVGLDAVAKRGAEGLLAVAVAGRGSLVVRCWDGSDRAVAVTALSALRQLGWINERTPFAAGLERRVLGGGRVVGSVRSVFEFEYQ